MRRIMKRLSIRQWLMLFFILPICVSLLGRQLSHGDNRNYQILQQELKAPDVIDTVLYDPDLDQLYVCYDDANQVDVYSEEGSFLWAVAVPYIRNTDFILWEGNLILYGNGDAYLYRAEDGTFVEKRDQDELEIPSVQTKQCPENFRFSSYRVWRVLENGGKQVLVSRPWWTRIFDFMLNWWISVISAAGMGIVSLLDRAKKWKSTRISLQFTNKRTERIYMYFRWSTVAMVFLIALEYLLAILGICPIFILFPVSVWYIISGIVLDNLLGKASLSEAEESAVMFWRACDFGAYILLFAASIGALMVWNP